MPAFFRSEVFKICLYVLGAFFVGALLAPALFDLTKWLAGSGMLSGSLQAEFERAEFSRVFNRAMLLGAVLGIWPLIKSIGLKPREFLQLDPNPRRWSHLGLSFIAGAGGLLLLGWILVVSGVVAAGNQVTPIKTIQAKLGKTLVIDADALAIKKPEKLDPETRLHLARTDGTDFQIVSTGASVNDFSLQQLLDGEIQVVNVDNPEKPKVSLVYFKDFSLATLLFAALLAGICVALLEEFFFRGCMIGLALRTNKKWAALAIVSTIFAAVHFLEPPADLASPETVFWWTGFWHVGQVFSKFADPTLLAAEFTLLFVVGWVLGWVRLRTNSLWLGIGLHAGWVFGIKFFSGLTRRAIPAEETMPWVGPSLRSGLASMSVLLITGGLVWIFLKLTWPQKATGAVASSDA
ncbi:MAG: membrane protease YdiL (CAAX protease family) [Verrucomicrobiales bacterium]|jgi:membrane protease YdiL (CAAX protease family)